MPLLSDLFIVGEYTVERKLNSISCDGNNKIVEPKVMALLYYFSCHANEVISRQQLMDDVWKSQVSDGAVNRVVGLLRKALADNAESPRYIQTVAKKGYRLIAKVSNIDVIAHIDAINNVEEINKTDDIKSDPHTSKTPQKLTHRVNSRRLIKSLLIGTSIALCFLFIFSDSLQPTVKPSLKIINPQFKQLTSEQGFEYEASYSDDDKWLVYRHRKKANDPYHLYLKIQSQQPIKLTDSAFNDRSPSFSHDKSKIVFFRKGNKSCHLNILNLAKNGQPLAIEHLYQCGAIEHYSHVVWSADDKSVYFTDRKNSSVPYQIYQLHIDTLKVDEITQREDNYYGDNELALSPNGEQLLFFRNKYWGNNQVFIKNLLSGKQRKITELGFLSWTPSWTPDGKSILFSDNRSGGKLKLLNIATGNIQTLYQSAQSINSPQLSRSGKHIIYSAETANVDIWQSMLIQKDEITNNTETLFELPKIKVPFNSSRIDSQPVYTKDGQSLLFLSNRNGITQLWLQNISGIYAMESIPSQIKIDTYSWHPDGDMAVISSSDKQLFLLNTQRDTVQRIALPEQSSAYATFSSDGRTLYFTSDKSGDWQIWAYKLNNKSTVQVTQKGGYLVKTNTDNGTLYFTKYRQEGIWQLDITTLKERKIIENVNRSSDFKVCSDSIFHLLEADSIELLQTDLTTAKSKKIMTSTLNSRFKFDVINDCQQLAFSKRENIESDILMLSL